MKLLSTLLIAFLLCHGGATSPIIGSIIDSINKGIGKGVDAVTGAIKGIGDITKKIVVKITDTAEGAIKTGVKFVNDVSHKMGTMIGTAVGKFGNIKESVDKTINSVSDIGGKTFEKVSNEMKNRISTIKDKMTAVMVDAQVKYSEGAARLNKTLLKNTEIIDKIAQEVRDKYENATDEQKEQIKDLVDNFVFTSMIELQECSNEILEPMQSLFNRTLKAVNDILPGVEGAAADMEDCIKNRIDDSKMKLVKCVMDAKKKIPTIKAIKGLVTYLKDDISKYRFDEMGEICFGKAMQKIEDHRSELEKKIAEILQDS